MARLPIFSSDLFNWRSGRATTTAGRLGIRRYPSGGFYVRSQRTGAQRLFLYDPQVNEDNDFWDGEAMAFMCPGEGFTVMIRASMGDEH